MMLKKIIVLIVLAMLSLTVMGLNASQQGTEKIGENKLIYRVKYVNGATLTNLIYEYLQGTPETGAYYANELHTIIITAPKDTHPLILNLINQFDVPPVRLQLHCYLLQNLPKGITSAERREILKPILGSILLTMPGKNYQLAGEGSILLSNIDRQYSSEIVITPDEVAGDDMVYRIYITRAEVKGDIANIIDFSFFADTVLAPAGIQEKTEKGTIKSFKLMSQNFSIKNHEAIVLGSITAKSKLNKELLLVVVLEEIKIMVSSKEPAENSILMRK